MTAKQLSIRKRLKRLFSMSDDSLTAAMRITQSTKRESQSVPMLDSELEVQAYPIGPSMTQSLTETHLMTCRKDCCSSEEEPDNPESCESALYTRRANRRACIIELGAMQDQSQLHLNIATLKAGDERAKVKYDKGKAAEKHSPRGRAETYGHVEASHRSKPILARYPSEASIYSYGAHRTGADKSKSLSRSIIKRLPSKKKSRNRGSLEEFLQYELKATYFHDATIQFYKCCDWRDLLQPEETESLSETETKRLNAIWELFHNECVFLVEQLLTLKHVFLEPLKRCQVEGFLMSVEPFVLFGNLDELCNVSYGFYQDFVSSLNLSGHQYKFGSTESLVDCLENMTLNCQHGDIFHSYLLNYKSALKYLSALRDEVEEFGTFENFCEMDQRCNRRKLTDLLVCPMHHWTRLPLLLTRIRDYTTDQDDRESLDYCLENVKSSLRSLDDKMEWQKTFERVKEIDKQLLWPSLVDISPAKLCLPESLKGLVKSMTYRNRTVLADHVREIVHEGQLLLTEEERTTSLRAFLFSDMLLLTKLKRELAKNRINRLTSPEQKTDYYKVIGQPMPVEELTAHSFSDDESASLGLKHAFLLLQTNKFHQMISARVLQSNTSLGKQGWIKNIKEASQKVRDAESNSLPKRQESFKELFNFTDSNNILKNCKILEVADSLRVTASTPAFSEMTSSQTSTLPDICEKTEPGVSLAVFEETDCLNNNAGPCKEEFPVRQHSTSSAINKHRVSNVGVDETTDELKHTDLTSNDHTVFFPPECNTPSVESHNFLSVTPHQFLPDDQKATTVTSTEVVFEL